MTELDRRHLIRSAAWAAPVVTMAAAAPLAAASGTGTLSDVEPIADGRWMGVTAYALPQALPEISLSYFTLNGEPALTPEYHTSYGTPGLLSLEIMFSGTILPTHTLTINIPGYAPVTSAISML